MDIETRLRDAKIKISQKESERTRAQVMKEQAEKSLQEIKDQLKSEFGVTSVSDLKALIEQLESDLHAELSSIEKVLSEEGA